MKLISLSGIRVSVFIRNALFLFILIYFAQGALYLEGTLLSKIILVLYLLIGAYFLYDYLLYDRRNVFGLGLFYLFVINFVYWLFADSVMYGVRTLNHFRDNVFFILTYYSFYGLAKKMRLEEEMIKIFFFALLGLYVVQYFYGSPINYEDVVRGAVDNNSAYYFVSLLPLSILFLRKRSVFFAIYAFLLYFVILGAKKGAIVTFAIGSMSAMYFLVKDMEDKDKVKNVFLIIIGLIGVSYFAYRQYSYNYYLQSRVIAALEGDSSGRDILYQAIIYGWYNSDSVINILFGYGFNGSRKIAGNYAHNDWLELLANYGVFGVFIYLFVFYGLIVFYFKNNKLMYAYEKAIYLSVLSMWFVQSLFSMGYTGLTNYTYTLMIGYLMGTVYYRKNSNFLSLYKKIEPR